MTEILEKPRASTEFYTPSANRGASKGVHKYASERTSTRESLLVDTAQQAQVICVGSESGGIGTSTFSALLALHFKNSGYSCALVDMDLDGGGLDVLLGLEEFEGLRWSGIKVPLGVLEPQSLCNELIHWEDIDVISMDSWNPKIWQEWEVQAVLDALCVCHDVVVIDCARCIFSQESSANQSLSFNFLLDYNPFHVRLVSPTVLGAVRERAWKSRNYDSGKILYVIASSLKRVGLCGRLFSSTDIDVHHIEESLEQASIGTISPSNALNRSLCEGLGIENIPRNYRNLFDRIVKQVL